MCQVLKAFSSCIMRKTNQLLKIDNLHLNRSVSASLFLKMSYETGERANSSRFSYVSVPDQNQVFLFYLKLKSKTTHVLMNLRKNNAIESLNNARKTQRIP